MTPAPLPSHILDKKFRPRPETSGNVEAGGDIGGGQVMTTAVLAVTRVYSGHSLSLTRPTTQLTWITASRQHTLH